MVFKAVRPGTPLKGHLTADWFNSINRQQERPIAQATRNKLPGEYFILDESTSVVVSQYEPVIITDQYNPVSSHLYDKQDVMLKCKVPAEGVHDNNLWAISQDNILGSTTPGKLIAVGVTWAYFTLSDEAHKYVKLDETTHTLVSTVDPTRAAIISFNESVPGTGYGLILLSGGAGSSSFWTRFELTSPLVGTVGATATAIFQDASTGTVTNTAKWRAFPGAIGVAVLVNGVWSVITVQQPARLGVVLAANPADSVGVPDNRRFGADPRSTNAYFDPMSINILTHYPFDFLPDMSSGEVPNPKKMLGQEGDYAILEWDASTADYYVAAVYPAYQNAFWATLTADRSSGLGATAVSLPDTPNTSGELPGSTALVDRFNVIVNAKGTLGSEDRVFAVYDHAEDEYVVIKGTHRATKVIATIASWVGVAPATFTAATVVTIDGSSPGTVTVENVFEWPVLAVGTAVMIELAASDYKWYPVNQPLTDLRVKPDGTALQKSFDNGDTWTDFATIGPCTPPE